MNGNSPGDGFTPMPIEIALQHFFMTESPEPAACNRKSGRNLNVTVLQPDLSVSRC
jgi:hypothetical protein